jgi:hypothetical protein
MTTEKITSLLVTETPSLLQSMEMDSIAMESISKKYDIYYRGHTLNESEKIHVVFFRFHGSAELPSIINDDEEYYSSIFSFNFAEEQVNREYMRRVLYVVLE